jgi:antitoxin component YwqK of YwqJK toxin-antitoxin module
MKNIFVIALFLVGTFTHAQTERDLKLNEENNLIEATFTNSDGVVIQKGTYTKEGKLHGSWISYDIDGNKTVSAYYDNGIKTGKWFFWTEDTLKEVDYSNNTIAKVNVWKNNNPFADSRRP